MNIGGIMDKIKGKWKHLTVIILLLTFIGLLVSVLLERELYIDSFMYDTVILNTRNDILTKGLTLITFLASPTFLVIASIVIFFILRTGKDKFHFTFNICFITLLNQILKKLILRPRPDVIQLVKQGGYSFPSGHSMASVAFYGYLVYLLWETKLNKRYKYIGTFLLVSLIILICFSRIYLGVHYASDVLAGICLSVIHLIIYIGIIKKKES